MSDLWPLRGTKQLPGLKQIRDSLAHGFRQEYSLHTIAVAQWHFARLLERVAFIVLGSEVPCGLQFGSYLLEREQWYDRSKWETVRKTARRKN